MKRVFEMEFEGRHLQVEIGEIAKQAAGACLIRYDDTVVLSTVCAAKDPKEGIDFFPLTVGYEEKQYAIGKIPGSFLRREGRPGEHATLTARLIDRPIRPMFPEGFRNEVQIVNTVMSVDLDATPEMAAMFGSSLALGISDIPFDGPIAGVYVGRVNGEYVINPTRDQKAVSDINLAVAGTEIAINMVESGAAEVSEEDMLQAIMFGHKAIKKLIAFQKDIIAACGKQKREIKLYKIDEELEKAVKEVSEQRLITAVSIHDKLERQNTIDAIEEEIVATYEEKEYKDEKTKKLVLSQVKEIMENVVRDEVRRLITVDKIRPDGRRIDEIRPLDAQTHLLPRVHGSAMFTRGQTQVISTCTLGALSDSQIIDNLTDEESKRFMHHYNFPPFSVGEVGRMGTPGRREIGHGALGERALSYVIPSEEEFPYTIRLVAEVVESNGSSSQASICASCMALMDAGVPIKAPVSGIAMGLITSGPIDGEHPYTILTDIQGMEDHLGDMDFKVAGTSKGVTALQMDIKIKGITEEVLREALTRAHKARAEILDVMLKAIPEPRHTLSDYALKMKTFNIPVDKIREVIGSQGKVINNIIEECDQCKIDINDDGRVIVYHTNQDMIDKACGMIESIAKVARVGEIYDGKVVRIESYGCFVNLFGNTDGMCHISRLAWNRVEKTEDVVKLGQTLKVIVTKVDENGRVDLSHREFEEKPADYVEPAPRPAKKNFRNDHHKGNKENKESKEVKETKDSEKAE